MSELIMTDKLTEKFGNYLRLEEKSNSTIEKYIRDIKAFQICSGTRPLTKELVIEYKEKRYAVYRVYHPENVDYIELYCERNGGTNGTS